MVTLIALTWYHQFMLSEITLLRLYIADPAGSDAKFPSPTLEAIIENHENDLYAAAAEVWSIRAGDVHEYYMAQIDGSLMSREQVFEHCLMMQKMYEQKAGNKMTNVALDSGFTSEEASSEF